MMRLKNIANRAISRISAAAVPMASVLEVKYWLGLDPDSLWGAAPLPNPPPQSKPYGLAVTGDLWRISSSNTLELN